MVVNRLLPGSEDGVYSSSTTRMFCAMTLANISYDESCVGDLLEHNLSQIITQILTLRSADAAFCGSIIIYNISKMESCLKLIKTNITSVAMQIIMKKSAGMVLTTIPSKNDSIHGTPSNSLPRVDSTPDIANCTTNVAKTEKPSFSAINYQLSMAALCNFSTRSAFYDDISDTTVSSVIKILSINTYSIGVKLDGLQFIYNLVHYYEPMRKIIIMNGILTAFRFYLRSIVDDAASFTMVARIVSLL